MRCVFCNYDGDIIKDYGPAFVIPPLHPVTKGHVLVIPHAHISDASISPQITCDSARVISLYLREFLIGSCNIISSVGKEATQTVFHMHWHIVPRKSGDGLHLPWS